MKYNKIDVSNVCVMQCKKYSLYRVLVKDPNYSGNKIYYQSGALFKSGWIGYGLYTGGSKIYNAVFADINRANYYLEYINSNSEELSLKTDFVELDYVLFYNWDGAELHFLDVNYEIQ